MTSIADIQSKSADVQHTAEAFVNHKETEEKFKAAVEALYNAVRSIKTGVEVGATADKLFRQSNLLNTSTQDLVNSVNNGGDVNTFYTRVKNGATNVQKTAQQLIEEGQ